MSYDINYSYIVNYGCQSQLPVSNNIAVNVGGTLRNYTLLNTSENPIEEDSTYTISVTAINPVGRSQASDSTIVHTLPSGGSLLAMLF